MLLKYINKGNHNFQFSILNFQFSILNFQFSILNFQFSTLIFNLLVSHFF